MIVLIFYRMILQIDRRTFSDTKYYVINLIFFFDKVSPMIVELFNMSFILFVNQITNQVSCLGDFQEYFLNESCIFIFICVERIWTDF